MEVIMTNLGMICITDVGSTTTKAILIDSVDGKDEVIAIAQAPTSVEYPLMDVRYGVYDAIKKLEELSKRRILTESSTAMDLKFGDQSRYLTTSSAGGGLQILVIGLTLNDSASSARRASLGAGGVILETFAIDDKRQTADQMLAMRTLHPDMILLSGGVDHGAITGVLRLAEIVRIANPQPKYQSEEKLPMLYAGNCEAADLIKRLISDKFDLHILPNLRPTMMEENFVPTQEKIRTLFMENVMEHAPGYKALKQATSHDIIPTPMGVLNSMHEISKKANENVFLVDIGGATTDVFSYIKGTYQRSVSANLGMSYSALNVLAEAGVSSIMNWLPESVTENELRNHIANKTINPTNTPQCDAEFMIEHALAREAIRLAFDQHQQMHFEANKVGFLDKMKNDVRDKFDVQFNFQNADDVYKFRMSDVDVIVGAGGIFSHCQNTRQMMMVLIDAIHPKGITEICRDKSFISPHMGVLSEVEPQMAQAILMKDCIEPLVMHIAPIYQRGKKPTAIMHIDIIDGVHDSHEEILSYAFHYYPATGKMRKIKIKTYKAVYIKDEVSEFEFESILPVIIDTREHYHDKLVEVFAMMELYGDVYDMGVMKVKDAIPEPKGTHTRKIELPYDGETVFSVKDSVHQDDVVALNRFAPPRLFVVNTTATVPGFDEQLVRACITVKPGEMVDFDQILLDLRHYLPEGHKAHKYVFYSPVRGKVEFIDYSVGLVIISEVQDYASKPVVVNIADALAIKPKQIGYYLKKNLGDFVYRNDLLANRVKSGDDLNSLRTVRAPNTGKIVAVDNVKGTITIHFVDNPYNYYAHVDGIVTACEPKRSLTISYEGSRIEGTLGVGEQSNGLLEIAKSTDELHLLNLPEKILCCTYKLSAIDIQVLMKSEIRALIVPAMEQSDLVNILGKELGVINTGNEKLKFPIVILHGFGNIAMQAPALSFLTAAKGKPVFVDPHTRIRAGVVRPSITVLN